MSSSKQIVFIKLGGSLITDKKKPLTVHTTRLRSTVKQLKELYNRYPNTSFIYGNGAGSFGHFVASQYHEELAQRGKYSTLAVREIHKSVSDLNTIIINEMMDQKLPVISLAPSSFMTSDKGRINACKIQGIITLLENGVSPLVYGDIIPDRTRVGYICSTERVFREIIKQLKLISAYTFTVLFCGTTNGVLDEKKQTIFTIPSRKNITKKLVFDAAEGFDVTGGMLHKVEESLILAKMGVKSYIVNATIEGEISAALSGKKFSGTTIF